MSQLSLRAVVRVADAPSRVGLNKSSYHQGVRDGLLPESFALSERARCVYEHELAAVVAARAAGQTPDQIRALVKRLHAQRAAAGAEVAA